MRSQLPPRTRLLARTPASSGLLSFFTFNFLPKGVERRTYKGRTYLLAPITTIVPGVLNGNKGPLLYRPKEIEASTKLWDDIPILVYHPQALDGGPLAALENPAVIRNQGIGFLKNSTYQGKLKHVGWFDEELTKEKDKKFGTDIYSSIVNGLAMEVSTGLGTVSDDRVARGANYRGKPYDAIALKYQPDHLAILPNQVGACSITDGCGLNVNSKGQAMDKIIVNGIEYVPAQNASTNQPRHPGTGQYLPNGSGHGMGSAHEAAKTRLADPNSTDPLDFIDVNPLSDAEHETVDDINSDFWKKFATTGAFTSNEERQAYVTYNERWPQSRRDDLKEKSPEDFAGPHGSFPIKSQKDVDSAAKLIGHADDPEAVKAKIKAIAKRKGLTVPEAWQEKTSNSNSGKSRGESRMTRKDAINLLTANCRCEGDDKVAVENELEGLSNNALATIVTNATKKKQPKDDEEDEPDGDEDEEDVMNDDESGESESTPMQNGPGAVPCTTSSKATGLAKKGAASGMPTKNKSMDDLLQNADEESREIWNVAKKAFQEKRAALINRLITPIKDKAQRKILVTNYQAMKTDVLETLAAAVPMITGNANLASQVRYQQAPPVSYYPEIKFDEQVNNAGDDDVLPIITMNDLEGSKKQQAATA